MIRTSEDVQEQHLLKLRWVCALVSESWNTTILLPDTSMHLNEVRRLIQGDMEGRVLDEVPYSHDIPQHLRVQMHGNLADLEMHQHQMQSFENTTNQIRFRFIYQDIALTLVQETFLSLEAILNSSNDDEITLKVLVARSYDNEDAHTIMSHVFGRKSGSLSSVMKLGTSPKALRRASSSKSVFVKPRVRVLVGELTQAMEIAELIDRSEELLNPAKGSAWIDVYGFDIGVISMLSQIFQLHPLTIEDILSAKTRQKLEWFGGQNDNNTRDLDEVNSKTDGRKRSDGRGGYIFAVFRSLQECRVNDAGDLNEDNNINVLIFDKVVLSLHRYPQTDLLQVARSRIRRVHTHHLPSSAAIAHTIVDCMSDGEEFVVSAAVAEVNTLEELVHVLSRYELDDLLKRMSLVRRGIMFFRLILTQRRDIISSLMHKRWRTFVTDDRIAYFRDVHDHVISMDLKLDAAAETLGGLESTYMAKISIDMARTSRDIDRASSKLTSVAVAIMPISFVTGLFGMNVQVPFQFGESFNDSTWAFFCILGMMAGTTVASALIFHHKYKS